MLPQVAEALEQLGWVQPDHVLLPDTLPEVTLAEAEMSAAEGRKLLRMHRTRERNRGLVARKKRLVLSTFGRLACEVCDFDFSAVYGSRGEGFAERHHIQPIAESAPGRRTNLSDLAVVCANCHRMLHRRPWMSAPELRALVRSRLHVDQDAKPGVLRVPADM